MECNKQKERVCLGLPTYFEIHVSMIFWILVIEIIHTGTYVSVQNKFHFVWTLNISDSLTFHYPYYPVSLPSHLAAEGKCSSLKHKPGPADLDRALTSLRFCSWQRRISVSWKYSIIWLWNIKWQDWKYGYPSIKFMWN